MSWQLALSSDIELRLRKAEATWGWIDLVAITSEELAGVCGYTLRDEPGSHFGTREYRGHILSSGKEIRRSSVWYRARDNKPVAALHSYLSGRSRAMVPIGDFQDWVEAGWRDPPTDPDRLFMALLLDRTLDPPQWTAWNLTASAATPAGMLILDQDLDPFHQLEGSWPTKVTRNSHIALIGVGSIGSATADALAEYDVGEISLIDPDRLLPHNLVRHQCGYEDLGRYKVDAIKDRLDARPGHRAINALRWNAIFQADFLRPLFEEVNLIICATDGVASRQAISHLARWAIVPAVFCCVLADGAIGEILRIRPSSEVGCLSCQRRKLRSDGRMDPESTLDRGYGDGTSHRPMTAVGGDLGLMGRLAAKVGVGTLLEDAGYRDQRLSDDHLLIGLRPSGDLAPPFDADASLHLSAHPLSDPIAPCPSCFPADFP